jgi:predicted dehydrogenase
LGFKNGLDVLCEKPVSLIVQEAMDMDKAAKEAKRIFMVAQVVRFWPEYAHLTRLIKTGTLKGIKQMTLYRYGAPPGWSEGNWMLSDKKSGGVIYDLAIHDIDYIVALLGMPKWIFAQRSMMGEDYTAYINIQFGYEGMNVAAEVGFIMPGTYPFTTGFRLSTGYEALEYINKKRNGLIRYSSQGEEKMVYDDYDPYQREIEHFLDCVKTRKSPEIGSGQQAVESLKVAQLIEKSVKINQRIEVE